MIQGEDKKTTHSLTGKLKDADIRVDDTSINVVLTFMPGTLQTLLTNRDSFERALKLKSSLSLTNMHLFNHLGKITKYDTVGDILKEFYDVRIVFYDERKKLLQRDMEMDFDQKSAKAQFIRDIHDGRITINEKVDGKNITKMESK